MYTYKKISKKVILIKQQIKNIIQLKYNLISCEFIILIQTLVQSLKTLTLGENFHFSHKNQNSYTHFLKHT